MDDTCTGRILTCELVWPSDCWSPDLRPARQLVAGLLVRDPAHRLGSGPGSGARGPVREQQWLAGLDWDQVCAGRLTPPIVPVLDHAGDSGQYAHYR